MDDAPRTSTLLKLAVGAALLMPIAALIIAVAFREWVMFPGALVSSVMYGVLGYFAVRGGDWARWKMRGRATREPETAWWEMVKVPSLLTALVSFSLRRQPLVYAACFSRASLYPTAA